MKKYLFILLCFIPFLTAASIQDMHKAVITRKNAAGGSCSGNYGRESASNETTPSVYQCIINQVTLDCSASSGTVMALVKDANDTSSEVIFAIYDDDGGSNEPNTLLWASSECYDDTCDVTGDTDTAFDDIGQNFSGLSLEAGIYWVGVCYESTITDMKYEASSGIVRTKTNTSHAAFSPWPYATDSNLTSERAYWISF